MRVMRSLAVVILLLAAGGCTTVPEQEPESAGPASPADPDPDAGPERSVVSVQVGQSAGSGLVLTADGHILTSAIATVGTGGEAATVTFDDGRSAPATIAGDDPQTGLAVLKVDGVADLTPAVFADSDAVQIGDEVRVIGGSLVADPVASGTVLDTSLRFGRFSAIGTDAPASRGAGGAPLVNAAGEVVGIVVGFIGTAGGDETAMALPASLAARVADQLVAGEPVAHPYLGVSVGLADSGGALVQQVAAGSPAGQAGMQSGDVLTRVGDRPIADPDDLLAAVQSASIGDQVTIAYTRDGTDQEATVTLGAAPEDQ